MTTEERERINEEIRKIFVEEKDPISFIEALLSNNFKNEAHQKQAKRIKEIMDKVGPTNIDR